MKKNNNNTKCNNKKIFSNIISYTPKSINCKKNKIVINKN